MKRIIWLVVVLLALVGCGGGDDLTGLWVSPDNSGLTADFGADGSLALRWPDEALNMDLAWSIVDDQFCLSDPGQEPQEGDCADYTLDGDRLAIRFGGSTIRLERWVGE